MQDRPAVQRRTTTATPRPVIVRAALHCSLLVSSSTMTMSGLWFSTASIITCPGAIAIRRGSTSPIGRPGSRPPGDCGSLDGSLDCLRDPAQSADPP